MSTLSVPQPRDPVAERNHERFGTVTLLSGLAYLGSPGTAPTFDHPLSAGWDMRGRRVYRCADTCGAHTLLCTTADAAAWHSYAAHAGIDPHTVSIPDDQRARFVAHVAHVWLDPDGTNPVVAFGWAGFPAVNPT